MLNMIYITLIFPRLLPHDFCHEGPPTLSSDGETGSLVYRLLLYMHLLCRIILKGHSVLFIGNDGSTEGGGGKSGLGPPI